MNAKLQLNTIYTPYCYLIGWTNYNKFYYGARYATSSKCLYKTGCHPDELWKTYFTSSTYVREFRKKYGEPDVIKVRKTFTNPTDAILWETKVLTRLNILNNNIFLNKNIGGNFVFNEDTARRSAEERRGKPHSRTVEWQDRITENLKKPFRLILPNQVIEYKSTADWPASRDILFKLKINGMWTYTRFTKQMDIFKIEKGDTVYFEWI